MTAGTRPDWENVGIEFREEVRSFGKDLIQKIRALPEEEQLKRFILILPAMFRPLQEALTGVMKNPEVENYLLPRLEEAMGHDLYLEFIGRDGKAFGYVLSTKQTPPFLELTQKKREANTFGLQILLRDALDLVESWMDEGRFVVPDILDFYCRGKMQLIMLQNKADWTGMSLFGGLMFFAPEIWAAMEERNTLDQIFREIQQTKV